ncbi:MAG: ribose transport system substrate-binding protein [Acidobacteriaceae bacterium]|nr:ribose transport system substrate-binding protein [Acidobacteriaceae bacterium]
MLRAEKVTAVITRLDHIDDVGVEEVGFGDGDVGAVALAVEILRERIPVPRAVFIKHQLLTPANLKQYYGRELQPAKQTEKAGDAPS